MFLIMPSRPIYQNCLNGSAPSNKLATRAVDKKCFKQHEHILLNNWVEVIKLKYRLKLKIKRIDWLLANKPIIVLYFEFENELKFYNLDAWSKFKIISHKCSLKGHLPKLLNISNSTPPNKMANKAKN